MPSIFCPSIRVCFSSSDQTYQLKVSKYMCLTWLHIPVVIDTTNEHSKFSWHTRPIYVQYGVGLLYPWLQTSWCKPITKPFSSLTDHSNLSGLIEKPLSHNHFRITSKYLMWYYQLLVKIPTSLM